MLTTKRVPCVSPSPISCTPKRVCGSCVRHSGRILLSHRPVQECCRGGAGTGQDPDASRAGTGRGTVPDPTPPIPSPTSCAHLSCCPLPGHHLPSISPPNTPQCSPRLGPTWVGGPRPGTSSHREVGSWEHWFPRGETLSLFTGAMVVIGK